MADQRHVRSRWSLPVFASLVSMAFVGVAAIPSPSTAQAEVEAPAAQGPVQSVTADGERIAPARETGYTVTEPPKATAPASGIPDPGTAQAIAYELVLARGWSPGEYDCLVALWTRESHWNVYAENPHSGAYGIPQALPGDKMASVGADWRTNPKTQIVWGLGYIAGRYETPCGAWAHSERKGWY
ncbi:MAG: lytic transglycosylase domain-containing protein [Microbacteriaceae bacterium]|nr:lytic transglycosylase domain-containing protein [Microbacteriaceae bacterium]